MRGFIATSDSEPCVGAGFCGGAVLYLVKSNNPLLVHPVGLLINTPSEKCCIGFPTAKTNSGKQQTN